MKRTLCALLALVLMLCCAAQGEDNSVEEFPQAGITLRYTDEYANAQGLLLPNGGTEIGSGTGVYYLGLHYVAMTEQEMMAFQEDSEEDQAKLLDVIFPLFYVIAIDGGRGIDDLVTYLGESVDRQYLQEIAKVEDVTFYSYIEPMIDAGDNAMADEYAALYAGIGGVLSASEYYKPVNPYAVMEGTDVSFETTDIDGNPIDSATLFAAHEYTMVNIWASWCGPCVNELHELDALNASLAESDCAVVGMLYDGGKASALESARASLTEKGATYLNLLPPANVDSIFPIEAFPTSFFVDRQGRIMGSTIVGADVQGYERTFKSLLGQ